MPILTVTTAASVTGLVALATLKEDIEIPSGISDAKLLRLIAEASAQICEFCNVAASQMGVRTWAQETMTVKFPANEINWRPRSPLILPYRRPITSITIVEDGDALESTDFELDYQNRFIYRLDSVYHRSSWSRVDVVVTIIAGWDLANEAQPANLRRATIEIVKQKLLAVDRDVSIKSEDVKDVMKVEYFQDNGQIPSSVIELIQPFVNLVIGD